MVHAGSCSEWVTVEFDGKGEGRGVGGEGSGWCLVALPHPLPEPHRRELGEPEETGCRNGVLEKPNKNPPSLSECAYVWLDFVLNYKCLGVHFQAFASEEWLRQHNWESGLGKIAVATCA